MKKECRVCIGRLVTHERKGPLTLLIGVSLMPDIVLGKGWVLTAYVRATTWETFFVRETKHRPKVNWRVLKIGHWCKLVEIMTFCIDL